MNIQEIRARHQEVEGWCVTCMQGEDAGSVPWPCDAAELVKKLEAVEKRAKELAAYRSPKEQAWAMGINHAGQDILCILHGVGYKETPEVRA